jgi:hypothetical protein
MRRPSRHTVESYRAKYKDRQTLAFLLRLNRMIRRAAAINA